MPHTLSQQSAATTKRREHIALHQWFVERIERQMPLQSVIASSFISQQWRSAALDQLDSLVNRGRLVVRDSAANVAECDLLLRRIHSSTRIRLRVVQLPWAPFLELTRAGGERCRLLQAILTRNAATVQRLWIGMSAYPSKGVACHRDEPHCRGRLSALTCGGHAVLQSEGRLGAIDPMKFVGSSDAEADVRVSLVYFFVVDNSDFIFIFRGY